ncbi:MAG: SDR family NAD(P)-dependent oxidoreductase [Rhizobiales bacterium]|nr:SDR family NAD(P)-dependent oxidoreductase [Hyphomicrobiales bacterium]OJY43500.1 MAG: short-chain dehydrogenase [Rhizobiales bacterium 64-17]
MHDFSGRTVIVTGGTGALGNAVVAKLIAAGARCRVPYRDANDAQRHPLRGDPNLTLIEAGNLADEVVVARLYQGVSPLWASIHIAGGFAAGKVADTDRAALQAQLDGNLVSCFLCCRAAIGAMQSRQNSGGRIVNVAARPALEWRTGAGMAAYAISKAGVAALTVAMAQETAGDGILVNAVAPSTMDTPANRKAMPKADHAAWPSVDDVAATILFLASVDNTVTRGAVVPVYGKS